MRNVILGGVLAAALSATCAMAQDKDALANEGKGLIKQFGDELRTELVTAMKEKGPVHAISVCNEKAPGIASAISASSGWSVGRSSYKLRNPNNAPDEFSRVAMEEFMKRIEGGEKAEDLAKAGIVEENGKKVFRLVKAIPTGEPCLACHGGAEVKPEVDARLKELYPDDQARGFRPGDMRGVFVLSKTLD